MTGIERLREFAEKHRIIERYFTAAIIDDIADQIESEQDATVAGSPYDALPPDEREAIAWVREHGGLDAVDAIWDNDVQLAEAVISELWPDGRPDECGNDDVMGELRRRLTPEGYEWPRYEGGPLLRYGDYYIGNDGDNQRAWQIRFDSNADVHVSRGGDGDGFDRTTWDHFNKGERVRRPAVPAADGKPLEVGQTVWRVDDGREFYVYDIDPKGGVGVSWQDGESEAIGSIRPDQLTHARPVLDADGVPIELGDDLYSVEGSLKLHVSNIDRVNCRIATSAMFALGKWADPSMFTHTKPEIDSWERIEEDATLSVNAYRERYGIKKHDGMTWPQLIREDIVRRCRALAERERGE